jgi:hypothetical protein
MSLVRQHPAGKWFCQSAIEVKKKNFTTKSTKRRNARPSFPALALLPFFVFFVVLFS